jgi:hypothetical protein
MCLMMMLGYREALCRSKSWHWLYTSPMMPLYNLRLVYLCKRTFIGVPILV